MFRSMLLVFACGITVLHGSGGWAQEKGNDRKALPEPSRSVQYKLIGGKALELHLFEPAKPPVEPAVKPAAIVFFFGGGWSSGSPSQFYAQADYLRKLGMFAACADYRVRSRDGAAVVDCVADAQDAVAYLRQQSNQLGIDPNRIVAAGGSAGGHLAAACATLAYRGKDQKEAAAYRPNALVLFNPAVILAITDDAQSESLEKDRAKIESLAARMGDAAEKLSPYHQLSANLPPTLILHGQADTTVPYKTVELFAKKAQQLGCQCKVVGYAGQPHGFFNYQRNNSQYEATRDEMVKFLRELKFLP